MDVARTQQRKRISIVRMLRRSQNDACRTAMILSHLILFLGRDHRHLMMVSLAQSPRWLFLKMKSVMIVKTAPDHLLLIQG